MSRLAIDAHGSSKRTIVADALGTIRILVREGNAQVASIDVQQGTGDSVTTVTLRDTSDGNRVKATVYKRR